MSERILDVRGKACPQPVMETRKILTGEAPDFLRVIVDNTASAENVTRMARSMGALVHREREADGEIHLILRSGQPKAAAGAIEARSSTPDRPLKKVVLISSNRFGAGDDELGDILMRSFIKTIKEISPLPQAVLFVNSGVHLTTEGSVLLDDIRALADSGVEILSCGTCLDFYHLKEMLQVGTVTNMYEILSLLSDADRTIRP